MGICNANMSKARTCEASYKQSIPASITISHEVLGSGRYGKVYLGTDTADPLHKYAVKVLEKSSNAYAKEDFVAETKVLQVLDHPNVLKYVGHSETRDSLRLITELCEGDNLFQTMKRHYDAKKRGVSESEAAYIIRELLMALKHCH